MFRVPSNWLLMVLAPSCRIRREAEGMDLTLEKGRSEIARPFFAFGGIMRWPRSMVMFLLWITRAPFRPQ
jgi:hypothetical protein